MLVTVSEALLAYPQFPLFYLLQLPHIHLILWRVDLENRHHLNSEQRLLVTPSIAILNEEKSGS
jgi:hypothetical protein